MDLSLRKVVVSSMAEVDHLLEGQDPALVQVHVDHKTPLVDALELNGRMGPGLRGLGAYQVFNPEVLARKVKAEAEIQAILQQMNFRIEQANHDIATTQQWLGDVQRALSKGPDDVRVGPSINNRAVEQAQVMHPTNMIMPEDAVGPPRAMSMTSKLRSRKPDALSQSALWDLNLLALQRKEEGQTVYRDALVLARDQFAQAALHQETHIGSGYSDYTFHF